MSEQRKYRRFEPQQKHEIELAGLRGDVSIKKLCRRHKMRRSTRPRTGRIRVSKLTASKRRRYVALGTPIVITNTRADGSTAARRTRSAAPRQLRATTGFGRPPTISQLRVSAAIPRQRQYRQPHGAFSPLPDAAYASLCRWQERDRDAAQTIPTLADRLRLSGSRSTENEWRRSRRSGAPPRSTGLAA